MKSLENDIFFGVKLPREYDFGYSSGGRCFKEACQFLAKKASKPFLGNLALGQRSDLGSPLSNFPCYLAILYGVGRGIVSLDIEDILRLCFRYQAGTESMVVVSVCDLEPNYKIWLEFAKTYPNVTIQEVSRKNNLDVNSSRRTVYMITFPGTACEEEAQ